jgi:UDP-galactopyranose mutase
MFFHVVHLSLFLNSLKINIWKFQIKTQLPKHKLLVYTGPIDAYFEGIGMPKLEYRSIYFEVINFLLSPLQAQSRCMKASTNRGARTQENIPNFFQNWEMIK